MALRGHTLIYGGSGCGYMGVISRSVKEAGGKAVGIIPTFFPKEVIESSVPLDELILVEDLSERKSEMARRSDAFIALPGGIGTLDEWSEMLAYNQLGTTDKPVGVLNIDHFYDALELQTDLMIREGFVTPAAAGSIFFDSDPASLLDRMEGYLTRVSER